VFSWFPDPFTLAEVLTLGADLYVDKAEGPGRLVKHLRAVLAEKPPIDETDDDRLGALHADLDALHRTARARRLAPGERQRYDHLLLIEARILKRGSHDAAVPLAASRLPGAQPGRRGWRNDG
jgi:DNA-binding response OmpR family regulator